jgi:hypothetical protein
MGVGSGEKVFVSCIIIATTNFCANLSSQKVTESLKVL